MGKGDRKTKRGKIWRGSHGKLRPRKKRRIAAAKPVVKTRPKAATKPTLQHTSTSSVEPAQGDGTAKPTLRQAQGDGTTKPKTVAKKTTKAKTAAKPKTTARKTTAAKAKKAPAKKAEKKSETKGKAG